MHLDFVWRTEDWILGLMLFISFLLLALAKRLEPQILGVTIQSFFTLGTPESLQKFDARFNSTAFILLSILFFISLLVCSTLFIQHSGIFQDRYLIFFGITLSGWSVSVSALLIIFLLIVYNFFGLFFTSWLTGEYNLIRIFITQSWVNLLFFGLVFFLLGLIWLLNPSINKELFHVFVYVVSAFFTFRFLKLLTASLMQGIKWYYIILYLCTLEILPIVVLYYYVA